MFLPLSCKRSVACPIHVSVVWVRFVFRKCRSVSANGKGLPSVGGILLRNLVQRHLRKSINAGSLESWILRYFPFFAASLSESHQRIDLDKAKRPVSQARNSTSDQSVIDSSLTAPHEKHHTISNILLFTNLDAKPVSLVRCDPSV